MSCQFDRPANVGRPCGNHRETGKARREYGIVAEALRSSLLARRSQVKADRLSGQVRGQRWVQRADSCRAAVEPRASLRIEHRLSFQETAQIDILFRCLAPSSYLGWMEPKAGEGLVQILGGVRLPPPRSPSLSLPPLLAPRGGRGRSSRLTPRFAGAPLALAAQARARRRLESGSGTIRAAADLPPQSPWFTAARAAES